MGVGAFGLMSGCQKAKPGVTGSRQVQATPAQTAAVQPAAQAAAEQTTCPVMGGPIDKSISVEYKGKKVYFCCNGCVATFQADPEKYVAKLPQCAQ
jgi:YHS domain-containing protein